MRIIVLIISVISHETKAYFVNQKDFSGQVISYETKPQLLNQKDFSGQDLSLPSRQFDLSELHVEIKQFICLSEISIFVITEGLFSKARMSEMGKEFHCNISSNLVIVNHQYKTLMLRKHYSDTHLTLVLNWTLSVQKREETFIPVNQNIMYTRQGYRTSVQQFTAFDPKFAVFATQPGKRSAQKVFTQSQEEKLGEEMSNMRLAITLTKVAYSGSKVTIPVSWVRSSTSINNIELHNLKGKC